MTLTRITKLKIQIAEELKSKDELISDIHNQNLPKWKRNASDDALQLTEKALKMLNNELQEMEQLEKELAAIPRPDIKGAVRQIDILMQYVSIGILKYRLSGGSYPHEMGKIIKDEWDEEVLYALGFTFMHNMGNQTMPTTYESVQFYVDTVKKSANMGFILAQFELGNIYEKGLGVPKDNKSAKYWWRKAAEQGLIDAKEKLNRQA